MLDDSTSAIDSATEDRIQKAIWSAAKGRTTLLITHRLSQIRWADHIVVLRQGRVVAQGKHEDLLRIVRCLPPHFRPLRRAGAEAEAQGETLQAPADETRK